MTIEDQIKDKKLQYDINREAAKISALSSGKIDKYEYLTSEEILPSNLIDINDSPIVLKEKEIYTKLTEESFKKISNLDKKVDTNKLVFKYKGNNPDEYFSKFDNALDLINKIRDGEFSLNKAKDVQTKLRSDTGEIKRVQKKHLLKESREARTNIENLYNTRNAAIDFFEEFTSRASEARRQAKKGTGLKTLTPKQILQILPICLAQNKADNNSESLLN